MAEDAVDEFIASHEPRIADLLRRLRALVRAVMPSAHEGAMPGRGAIGYGGPREMADMVCYISGHRAHANLGFTKGTSLPDPDGLLEGTGKHLRHVKVRRPEEVDRPALRRLLEAAART